VIVVREPLLSSYHIQSEIFTDKLKLKDAVCADMEKLNLLRIGATKSEENFAKWKADGVFRSFAHCVYIYHHTYHATFSAVKYSQLSSLWKVQSHERSNDDKRSICKVHKYHDHLVPFFQTNDCFKFYIEEKLEEEEQKQDISTNRVKYLKEYQKQLQKETVSEKDLLYEPPLAVNNWNENHWNLRLFHTIQAAFPDLCVQLTAHKGLDFSALQSELSDRVCQPDCFIFRGAPDIIINQARVIISHSVEEEEESSSGEESTVIEQAFQRHPMKGKGSNIPEKLGELIAALYFSLMCKMLRKINKRCKLQCYSVNGLLLDKMVGGMHCKLTGNITQMGDTPTLFFKIRDACGKQLDAQSLCYNIQLLQT